MDWLNIAALASSIALFAVLMLLRRRRVNFSLRTIIALGLGVAVGIVFQGHTDLLKPLGTAYLHVLLAIVSPLIIVSLLASVIGFGDSSRLKSIGLRSVFWLTFSTLLAILLTLGLALVTGIGNGAGALLANAEDINVDHAVAPFTQVFIDLFPTNVISDIGEDKIIPIIFFTVLIAVSYVLVAKKNPELVKPFGDFVLAAKAVIYKAVSFIIRATPYAVLAFTATATSSIVGDANSLWALLGLLGLTYVACFTHAFVINGVLLRTFAQVNPFRFFRNFFPAQATAFTTQSSVATLPVTTEALTSRIGVPEEIATFTAPLGATIGMPGCSGVWPILIAVFGVNALGLNYGPADYLLLILLGLVVSLGTAGVPGTATVTTATVLAAAGLPLELIAVTLPISAIADMARTLTSVTAAGVSATIVARKEGRLDDSVFNSDAIQESEREAVSA